MLFETHEELTFHDSWLSADNLHDSFSEGVKALQWNHATYLSAQDALNESNFHDRLNGSSVMTLTETSDEDPIVVVGKKPPLPDLDGGGLGSGGSTGGGGTTGGGGDGGGSTDPEANPTPCVETTPLTAPGATQQEINDAALAASKAIAAKNDETYEYSSIIYSLNGQVGYTTPFTQNNPDKVNLLGGIASVPNGAVIVGSVHNHPDDPGMTDTIPSGGLNAGSDWDAYSQMVNYNRDHATDLPRGITVDPNLLMYIYSDEDHETHVYDNTDKTQTTPSCSL